MSHIVLTTAEELRETVQAVAPHIGVRMVDLPLELSPGFAHGGNMLHVSGQVAVFDDAYAVMDDGGMVPLVPLLADNGHHVHNVPERDLHRTVKTWLESNVNTARKRQ